MVEISPTQSRSAGNLSEREVGQTHMPVQKKNELTDSSGSHASTITFDI